MSNSNADRIASMNHPTLPPGAAVGKAVVEERTARPSDILRELADICDDDANMADFRKNDNGGKGIVDLLRHAKDYAKKTFNREIGPKGLKL